MIRIFVYLNVLLTPPLRCICVLLQINFKTNLCCRRRSSPSCNLAFSQHFPRLFMHEMASRRFQSAFYQKTKIAQRRRKICYFHVFRRSQTENKKLSIKRKALWERKMERYRWKMNDNGWRTRLGRTRRGKWNLFTVILYAIENSVMISHRQHFVCTKIDIAIPHTHTHTRCRS